MLLSNGSMTGVPAQMFSETSPIANQSYFLPETGLTLETRFATYGALYKAQPWVAVVVNKIANLIARLGVNVWDDTAETGKTIDLTSPYAKLLAKPSATLDPFSFWLWVASTFEIYGEAFVLKNRDDKGRVIGLVPMHPSRTQIERDQDGNLLYRFMGRPHEMITEADVIPFIGYNPDGSMRGWSRLEPLRNTLRNEDSARRATDAWWKNMGRPSMILSSEKSLSKDAKVRLGESFSSVHGGSGNAGKTLVLSDGLTATQMQLNAEEMQYIESRKLNREEVCAVYDMPPTAVHILDNATYSNITEQMRSVYRDTMAPRLEFIESVLDFHLGSDFNGQKVARFSVAEVLRGDYESRAQAAVQLVQSGIMKPSEARDLFDLNEAGAIADRLYANAAIQPLGQPQERLSGSFAVGGSSTPDGIPVLSVPATSPGAAPIAVPATQPPGRVPAGKNRAQQVAKHVRSLNGAIGGGMTMQEAGAALLQKNPTDHDLILDACREVLGRKAVDAGSNS